MCRRHWACSCWLWWWAWDWKQEPFLCACSSSKSWAAAGFWTDRNRITAWIFLPVNSIFFTHNSQSIKLPAATSWRRVLSQPSWWRQWEWRSCCNSLFVWKRKRRRRRRSLVFSRRPRKNQFGIWVSWLRCRHAKCGIGEEEELCNIARGWVLWAAHMWDMVETVQGDIVV